MHRTARFFAPIMGVNYPVSKIIGRFQKHYTVGTYTYKRDISSEDDNYKGYAHFILLSIFMLCIIVHVYPFHIWSLVLFIVQYFVILFQ